jgi:hypothetical protein
MSTENKVNIHLIPAGKVVTIYEKPRNVIISQKIAKGTVVGFIHACPEVIDCYFKTDCFVNKTLLCIRSDEGSLQHICPYRQTKQFFRYYKINSLEPIFKINKQEDI